MATILQIINADRNLSSFIKGVKKSGLEDKLNEYGPFTILGPVNLAFGKLDQPTFDEMMGDGNAEDLVKMFSGYVLSGKKMFGDFRNLQKLQTIDGKDVLVTFQNGEIHINGAKILAHDRQGSNGVVHQLDRTYSSVVSIENVK